MGMARTTRSIGLTLLGIYLVLIGLGIVIPLPIPFLWVIQGLLALSAGILILIGR